MLDDEQKDGDFIVEKTLLRKYTLLQNKKERKVVQGAPFPTVHLKTDEVRQTYYTLF